MPQGKKLLILNVLEILKKHSDAEHRLSVTDIVGILKKEYDMTVDRKAVKRNLDELRDMGYRISSTDSVRKKKDGTEEILQTDWYLSSDFSEAELRIIIDSLINILYIQEQQRVFGLVITQGHKVLDLLREIFVSKPFDLIRDLP